MKNNFINWYIVASQDDIDKILKNLKKSYKNDIIDIWRSGRNIFLNFGDWAESPSDVVSELKNKIFNYNIEWDYEIGYPNNECKWEKVSQQNIRNTTTFSPPQTYIDIGHDNLSDENDAVDIILFSHNGKQLNKIQVLSTNTHGQYPHELDIMNSIIYGRVNIKKNIGSLAIEYYNNSSIHNRYVRNLNKAIIDVTMEFPQVAFYVSSKVDYNPFSQSNLIPLSVYMKALNKESQSNKYPTYLEIGHGAGDEDNLEIEDPKN